MMLAGGEGGNGWKEGKKYRGIEKGRGESDTLMLREKFVVEGTGVLGDGKNLLNEKGVKSVEQA